MRSRLDRKEWEEPLEMCSWATSYIFEWHRLNDDGLWLDDGRQDGPEAIRALQSHPWIRDDNDYAGLQNFKEDETSGKSSPALTRILEWRDNVVTV